MPSQAFIACHTDYCSMPTIGPYHTAVSRPYFKVTAHVGYLMKRINGHCAIPRESYSSSSAECACRAICMRSLLLIARDMAFFTSIG